MSTTFKIGLGLAFLGVVALVATQGKKILEQFDVTIKGYGIPSLNLASWVLTLPVKIEFFNPTPAAINLDKISGRISLIKNGTFQPVVTFNQPLSIQSGKSEKSIIAQADIKKFFSFNFGPASMEILTTGSLRVRTDMTVQYGQVVFTPEPFDSTIDVI
jgi:hypothetical protein